MNSRLFPIEVTSDTPRLTMTGSMRVQVEQHKGLVTYLPEEIVFRCASGRIRIVGEELRMERYASQEAVVVGRIAGVSIEDGGRKA